MSIAEDKNTLKNLFENSASLSSKNKELIKNNFDTLSEEQMKNLAETLKKESADLSAIEKTYKEKQLPLKIQYLKIIEEFKQKGLKRALQKWEKVEESNKDQKLEMLINTFPQEDKNKQKKIKPAAVRYFILATIFIALIITGYLIFTRVQSPPKKSPTEKMQKITLPLPTSIYRPKGSVKK